MSDAQRELHRRRMGRGRRRLPQRQSLQHRRCRRPLRAGERRAGRTRRSRPPGPHSRRGRAPRPQERHDILLRASTEILARREELGKLLAREEGKTLPEAIGEVDPRRADFRFLRRRGAAHSRREARQRAARCRHRTDARGGRRRRHHRAVEFPDRHSRLEDRARARLRQLRPVQAGRSRAGLGARARRDHRARRRAQGRVQPGDGPRLGGRPDDARPPPYRRDHLHRIGRHRAQGGGGLRRAHAQVPARNGRQEPAGRARRRRPQDRRRMRGQRRVFLDRPALHRLFAPHRHRRGSIRSSPRRWPSG